MNHYTNKKSLALLGHGKWKSALGHTLLLIGMVLGFGGMNVWAQDPIPAAVKLDKQFIPDDATGHSGKIVLETYVTGKVTQVTATQPTDIVLVLDYSASMTWEYGNSGLTRRKALEQSVEGFVEAIQEDAENNGVEHRLAVVKFSSQAQTSLLSVSGHPTWGSDPDNPSFSTTQYQDALVVVNDHGNVNSLLTNQSLFNGVGTETQTKMDAGMRIAYQILLARAQEGGGGTTFVVPDQTPALELPRNQVVVFFTDGYPTTSHGGNEGQMQPYWRQDWDMDDIANATCSYAAGIKGNAITSGGSTVKPTVFSIGIHGDCDPEAEYETTYGRVAGTNARPVYGWTTGVQCLNGLLHLISSDYDETYSSWSAHTEDCGFINEEHYLAPQDANDLIEAFGKITSAAGSTPVTLGSNTVVQDIISPSFQLPEGTDVEDIIVYAPKVTNATGTEGNYVLTFADTTTVKVSNQVQFLTMVDGVVQDNDEKENRINPQGLVDIGGTDGKQLTFKDFDFSKQFCGPKVEGGEIIGCEGRKLVIVFPIEIEEGVWGDGINTNSELSFVTPDGTIKYQFPMPNANVLGDVWTEIVTSKPTGYDNMNIDSPEDLAWFISEVNGRIHYNGNTNNVASNPSLPGRLTADIDMSAHNWVPIGAGYQCNANNQWLDANGNVTTDLTKRVKLAYEGTFDGNGHVITGLKNNADKWYKTASGQENEVVVYPGMFSNVKGTVHDVFILDSDFRGKAHQVDGKGKFIHHGILADTLTGGTIYNCEAAGRMTCNNDNANDVNLIYGGLVGLNNGGTIYNAMAMAELTGYTMGGAVGENSGSFSNGFTNGVYKYLGSDNTYEVGGIAGTNAGTINNCYVRFERLINENLNKATFDQLVGSGTAATNCYIQQLETWSRPNSESTTTETNLNTTVPNTITSPADNPANSYTLSVNKTFYNLFTNDNMTDGEWGTTTISGTTFNVYENGTPLVEKLNENKGTGATWKRTTAGNYDYAHGSGNINGDFPVLQLDGYTCLGSSDGIRIDYAHNLSDMLHRHNSGALNENTALADSYKVTDHAAINGGSINLFANEDMNPSNSNSGAKADLDASYYNTDANVVVYIDENISLLQPTDATTTPSSIEAYTGQTLQAYNNTAIQEGNRWHNISSSLSNSKFGWGYSNNGQVAHNWEPNPCGWLLNNHDEDQAFYPIDLSSWHRGDFYCFYEPQYHWLNFRRNKLSHWHMDDYSVNIPYPDQEDHFIPGKGYLTTVDMSTWWEYDLNGTTISKKAQFLQNRGTLNNGNVEIKVTASAPDWTGLKGYNLIGNPYQSYLDFEKFITENTGEGKIWSGDEAFAQTYAVYDPEAATYLQYKESTSKEAKAADQNINMHQGFMIRVSKAGTAKFTNDMRTNTKGSGFRGTENHYPLINFTLNNGTTNDVAVLEIGRPENDGALKLRVGDTKGRISLRHDNTDFGILFRDITEGSQPLYFETEEDGTFTLSWNTANANFSSLTLVDNLTGVRYDMLANDSYSFEGKASDYRSRFKVVIGRFTGIDEEDGPSTGSGTFAFFDGSDWVVNGQGQLTVTDMTGRTVYTSNLTNDQNRVSLNGVANGIYLMRVANGQNVNVQKIIIK